MAKAPQGFLGYTALLGDPVPSKWDRVKQALWDSNLNAPIRGVYNLMNADPYTLYTDEGAAGQQAATDSFDAAGGVTVGSMPMPKPSNALSMGIKAYHGSPHSFDKFSMDKIGTGEGAQAYGHGLYFAENEGVARGYRDTLKPGKGTGPEDTASRILDLHGGDVDAAVALLRDSAQKAMDSGAAYEDVRRLQNARNILISEPERARGSMYEVNIDADPNTFLDWDKPLSEQPQNIQDAFKDIPQAPDIPGQLAYYRLGEKKLNNPEASAKLKEAGIPGIKYLDAGSRGAGDGTRNYVVFDDKLISIVKKYGIAGASAMVGYNVLQGLDKAQAATLNKADLNHKYDQFLRSGGI